MQLRNVSPEAVRVIRPSGGLKARDPSVIRDRRYFAAATLMAGWLLMGVACDSPTEPEPLGACRAILAPVGEIPCRIMTEGDCLDRNRPGYRFHWFSGSTC